MPRTCCIVYKKCILRKEITSGREKGLTSNIENVRRVTSHKDRDSVWIFVRCQISSDERYQFSAELLRVTKFCIDLFQSLSLLHYIFPQGTGADVAGTRLSKQTLGTAK